MHENAPADRSQEIYISRPILFNTRAYRIHVLEHAYTYNNFKSVAALNSQIIKSVGNKLHRDINRLNERHRQDLPVLLARCQWYNFSDVGRRTLVCVPHARASIRPTRHRRNTSKVNLQRLNRWESLVYQVRGIGRDYGRYYLNAQICTKMSNPAPFIPFNFQRKVTCLY